MSLRLFDTRRGEKVPFAPIGDGPVGLYVCGVTPYDTGHLGHAFTYLSFDVLHRYLEYLGHRVVYVQNLTDVDDDMLKRARQLGVDYLELGNRHVTTFLTEMAALNWLPPDHYPRATQHIDQMQELITRLLRSRPRLPGRRPRLLRRRLLARLRRALGAAARGDAADRQRARQRARPARQAEPARFRAVAAIGAGRAIVAVAVGRRPARLAHRVLRHEHAVSGVSRSRSTAVAVISSSRTTSRRSPSRRGRPASSPSLPGGCTPACCASPTRR